MDERTRTRRPEPRGLLREGGAADHVRHMDRMKATGRLSRDCHAADLLDAARCVNCGWDDSR